VALASSTGAQYVWLAVLVLDLALAAAYKRAPWCRAERQGGTHCLAVHTGSGRANGLFRASPAVMHVRANLTVVDLAQTIGQPGR
jgi:hypothetical protein